MLLPERVTDLSDFAQRPLWSVVHGGALERCRVSSSRLEGLASCSLVVARRRHAKWYGPIGGFTVAPNLERARLVELLDVDLCPWADRDAARFFRGGLEAVLEYVRLFGGASPKHRRARPGIEDIVLPEGLAEEGHLA